MEDPDYLSSLSDNLLFEILKDYPYNQIKNICLVNRDLNHRICLNEIFWKYYSKYSHLIKPENMTYIEFLDKISPYMTQLGEFNINSVEKAIDNNNKFAFDALYNNYPDLVDEYYIQDNEGWAHYRRMREKYPHVFAQNYPRICQRSRQLRLYQPAEQSYWKNHQVIINGISQDREIFPFPPDDPELYLISPSDDYPYPGIIQNNRLDNRLDYPFLPCANWNRAIRDGRLRMAYPDLF